MEKNKKFYIYIDNKKFLVKEGETILDVTKRNNISIPTLCFHPDLEIKETCRMCLVKIKGEKELQTACSTKVKPGMNIKTNTSEIRRARKINLQLIFAQHSKECQDCVWISNCEILKLVQEYNLDKERFKPRKNKEAVYQFGPALLFDSKKCIGCDNCVEVCQKQGVGFLEIKGRGINRKIVPSKDKGKECIYCGQCLVHCPSGSFEGIGEFEDIEKPLKQKDKVVVFQFAPSIRSSIGEEFGYALGSSLTGKLSAGIRKLGIDWVFDVSVGADFTTIEEAKELIERLEKGGKLPMFTSCCPAWVRFIEFFYPEFIPHLTTVRSPHIILGGLIKTYWAEKQKIDPKNIFVVSIMPCIAKKYEITREELKINGLKPVDYVLTTRGLAQLFKKYKIDLKKISPEKPDFPLGSPSGSGLIYGSTGGVMESALRTVSELITNNPLKKIDFKKVRGLKGVKKAKIKIGENVLKVAVVNGNGHARKILEKMKNKSQLYDYIEVMACPGGCVGGGGQPLPVNNKVRKKRAQGLYKEDKKKKVRLAHKNPIIAKVYEEYFKEKKNCHLVCHTHFSKKNKKGANLLPPGQY